MNTRRWLIKVALASAVTVAIAAAPSTAFASGFKVPFTDPNQVGSLTLCNSHEQPITSGSLLTIPFVWRAVSSARVPAHYTRATLYLFQPLQYIDPGDWTSYQLTDDAAFSNPAHPMAQATYADNPLIWPDHSMPPYWDGMYQLRMIFTSPNEAPWTSTYPAAVIKVKGYNWTLVQGGGSSCTDGTAESVESVLLPKSQTAVPKPPERLIPYADTAKAKSGSKGESTSPTTTAPIATSTTTTQATVGSSTTTSVAGSGSSRSAIGDTSSKGGGSSGGAILGGAIAALVLVGLAALFVLRRRRVA
ncbi:MAG: hypothetical protein ABSD97_10025 [Acidimicrobiales bacterium]|jgi:MYXO-CTERM domain-containing protein